MEIRKLALIHKEGIKPPYYIKLGDEVEFFLFNEIKQGNFGNELVDYSQLGLKKKIIDEKHVSFYKGPRAGNRDFFRLVSDEDSKR